MTQSTQSEVQESVPKAIEELQRVRDELKVRVHLAGMEAKDVWNQATRELDELTSSRPATITEQALGSLREKLAKVRDALK
jgi:hypothetical protein